MAGILDERHDDWIWPFSYIPRRWTAVESEVEPTLVASSPGLDKPDDIPNPGNWALMKSKYGLNFSAVSESGWLFSIGTFRYDYVDRYYQLPRFTIKKLK